MSLVLILGGIGGLLVTSGTASADVDSVEGTGFGLQVSLAGNPIIGPSPDPSVDPPRLVANESSVDFGPNVSSVVTLAGILGILNDGVAVGPVSTQASDIVGDNHLGSIATISQVANVNILSGAVNVPLVVSSCISNGNGSIGATTISNATIGGNQLLDGPVAPNTVIDIIGVARVVLNEQIVVNTPPLGGNPGTTQITVNAVRVSVPSDGSILDIILAQSFCRAVGPDVLLTTTSTTSGGTTTTTSGGGTTTTTAGGGTTTTTAAGATTTTAGGGTTTTTVTGATTTTVAGATTTTSAGVVTSVSGGILVRTGGTFGPLAMLSGLSIVAGVLLLIGSGRPLAGAGTGSIALPVPGTPERWGPVEIAKALWAALAALCVAAAQRLGGRRRKSPGDDGGG